MPSYTQINTDFTGGLMSPHLRGRLDIDKFNKGLQRMENFLPSIQGPTSFRQGLEWIREEAPGNVRLIEFTINNRSRFLLALSAGLLRIYATDGSLLYTRGGGVKDSISFMVTNVTGDQGVEDTYGFFEENGTLDGKLKWRDFNNGHIIYYDASGTPGWVYSDTDENPLNPSYKVDSTEDYPWNETGSWYNFRSASFAADYPVFSHFSFPGEPVAADDGFGQPVTVPYLDDQIMDVRYSREVETMIFTHPMHPPYELTANTIYDVLELFSTESPGVNWALQDSASTPLYAGAVGSEGLRPWSFQPVTFTSHPFQKIDTSDTVLKISDEVERVRLISSAADWVAGDVDKYTEYKVGNQWSLGKIVEFISSTEVMVDPVESVVNIGDPSVRLAMFDNRSVADPLVEAKGWLERDGVDAGKTHVRADTLIFRTSHIGSWVRIGGDRLLTNVCDPVGSAAFNSQDEKVRWGKIVDYRGVEDHPVEFVYGSMSANAFESGEVYEVYDWGGATELRTLGAGFDGAWNNNAEDRSNLIGLATSTGNSRLSAGSFTAIDGTPGSGAIVANMSTQRQFDVVEVSNGNDTPDYPEPLLVSGENLISPSGDVSAYDLVTDPKKLDGEAGNYATHTATVTSSRLFFDESRDVGRYLLGSLVDRWVLMQINGNSILSYSAQVDVLTSIPRDELTDDLKNNGVFTQFRWGAWYENNYPSAVSFYEQRRVFAGTRDHPNLVWLSSLNDPTDFRTVENDGQVIDTTGITYQLGTGSTIISWLETGPTLIVGTESNEWQLRPNEFSAAITPSNIRITQETSIGSQIQGRRIGGSVFFPHISGKQLHEFKFDFQSQQFVVETVTKLVPDLLEDDPIRSMSYQFHPNSTIWIVTEGGNLFSLTYRKEDDYYAWAKHTTIGTFKDVVVVPKGDTANSEDQVWFIVERGGVNELERMAVSFTDSGKDNLKKKAAFLDSFTRYPEQGSLETPATIFGVPSRCIVDGLTRVVVDGVDLGLVPVSPGVNNLPGLEPATDHILVGLPYTGVLQMNPQVFDSPGKNAYGQIKRIVSMRPYLYKSMGYKVGFFMDNLEQIEPSGGTSLFTGFTEEHTILDSNFDVDETPLIVQDKAYPLTLVSNVIKTDLH